MDPDLLARLMSLINPISSAQAAGPMPLPNAAEFMPTGAPMVTSPPEMVVPGPMIPPPPASLAGATAPPPPATPASPVPGVPTPSNPIVRPQEAYRSEAAPTVGSVLEPRPPLPIPRPAAAGTGATEVSAAAKPSEDALLKTLRGVQLPKPPEVQRVSTPHAPALRPIQSSIADLFASLGVTPQQALAGGGLKLPSTLGAALGGR